MSVIDTLITDRTLADVQQGRTKGFYNYTDLNRVGNAQIYLRDLLATVGADTVEVVGRADWIRNNIPRRADMERYLEDTAALQAALFQSLPLPASIRFLDYAGANQIEAALKAIEPAVQEIKKSYLRAGTLYAYAGAPGIRFAN